MEAAPLLVDAQLTARQIIHVEAKNEVRKRIVRELRIMHDCNSEYIVAFYGAFQNESGDVIMCMEYMDVGYVTRQQPTATTTCAALTGYADLSIGSPRPLVLCEWTFSERFRRRSWAVSHTCTRRTRLCIAT